jgi:hypothetical protein
VVVGLHPSRMISRDPRIAEDAIQKKRQLPDTASLLALLGPDGAGFSSDYLSGLSHTQLLDLASGLGLGGLGGILA